MARKFIRGLWGTDDKFWSENPNYVFPFGEFDRKNCCAVRRQSGRIDSRMKGLLTDTFTKINDQMVYVYGEDNASYVASLNIPYKLIHPLPLKFHPILQPWLHKLEILKIAMEDYDEIIWLDLDCMPLKTIDDKIWDVLRSKDSFQSPLHRYKRVQTNLRSIEGENKILPSGSFVYIRDKDIPGKMIDIFLTLPTWTDEIAYAKYTDDLTGGFDLKRYYDRFEPYCVSIIRTPYNRPPQIKISEEICFKHV